MDKRQEVIKYIASVEKQLYALFGNTYHELGQRRSTGKGTGVRSIREDFGAAERNYRHLRTGSKGTPGQRSNGARLR